MTARTILEFTPLEFETEDAASVAAKAFKLEFTPLEFETIIQFLKKSGIEIRIYSVGV